MSPLNNPPQLDELTSAIGGSVSGSAVTDVLYVSPNGNNSNGTSWVNAYTAIQTALDAASTDGDECTLILVSPHTTFYDINTTGDPTWAANVIIRGTNRAWATIKNTHASATSILKLTGKSALEYVNFDLGTGSVNGVIMTNEAFVVRSCQFVGESLTGAATALHFDGAVVNRNGILADCNFEGNATYMTGILIDKVASSTFDRVRMHECLVGIKIVGAGSDDNLFAFIDIGESGTAIDIDAGGRQHFHQVILHENTVNIDDEVGDHVYSEVFGQFDVTIEPDNFTGVVVTAHNIADTWGADTEIRAAATSTKPFRVIAVHFKPTVDQLTRIRFSADSGATHYDDVQFTATKRESGASPSGTEHIFNKGTRISASAKAVSGGEDTIAVWLELQEI